MASREASMLGAAFVLNCMSNCTVKEIYRGALVTIHRSQQGAGSDGEVLVQWEERDKQSPAVSRRAARR